MQTETKISRAALPMTALVLPIIIENIFRMLVSSVDTFMLSGYSPQSVAGVGLVSQFIFFMQVIFSVISTGTSIVLAQYLGAKRTEESGQVAQASAVMVLVAGVVLGAAVLAGAKSLLGLYTLEPAVREAGLGYLVIYGGAGSLFIAFNIMQGTILRSYGYTRDAMFITFAANIINIIGNSLSLYGFFGLPVLGVAGVAASSAFSQLASCALFAWRIQAHPDVQFSLRGWRKVPASIYRKILSVGVPTAGEALAYNISQIVIAAMVTAYGTWAMSAQVYTQTILRFVYVTAMSIGIGVQLKTGYLVGAKQGETAYRRVWRYQAIGTLVSLASVVLINLAKRPLIGIFTDVPEITGLCASLLLVSVFVELGRSVNLVTIPALKGAGDIRFPVVCGMISMWGISVAGSWLLGSVAGLGLVGVWIAAGCDEGFRAVLMLARWKSRKWQTKAIG